MIGSVYCAGKRQQKNTDSEDEPPSGLAKCWRIPYWVKRAETQPARTHRALSLRFARNKTLRPNDAATRRAIGCIKTEAICARRIYMGTRPVRLVFNGKTLTPAA